MFEWVINISFTYPAIIIIYYISWQPNHFQHTFNRVEPIRNY